MCGIAGAVDLRGSRYFCRQRLWNMTEAIAHRGPEDAWFHDEAGVSLGARRLSIVDLEGGRQPISNAAGDVWVAFNGELFDYPELRQDFLARGHKMATRCDTEAWLHLHRDFGELMFERARGQFAVSLWDRKHRTLLLGRDRVGICPLYYAERDGWLLYASEIKSLLASGLVEATPDIRGINHFFAMFCASSSRTLFEGVHTLPPGHYLKIREGRVEVKQYWDLDFPDQGDERRTQNPQVLVDEMEEILRHSVRRRLRGDVPVVSYLSGGLDSTMVLGLSTQERGGPLPSFTINLDQAGPNELAASQESASVLNSPMHTLTMNQRDIADAYPALIQAAEYPVMDTSAACLLRLAQRVNQHGYKVALTGEGADEALAGYVWFKTQMMRQRTSRIFGRWLPKLFLKAALASIGGGSKHRMPVFPMQGVRTAQQDIFDLLGQSRELFFTSQLWDRLGDHSPYDEFDISHPRFTRWHPLNQGLYVGYKTLLGGMLLVSKGDRIAMNSSVETRYPFLDEDFTSFCAQIAPEYKLRGRTEKWLLRQVAAKSLPTAIAQRPKTMFRATKSRIFLAYDRPA